MTDVAPKNQEEIPEPRAKYHQKCVFKSSPAPTARLDAPHGRTPR